MHKLNTFITKSHNIIPQSGLNISPNAQFFFIYCHYPGGLARMTSISSRFRCQASLVALEAIAVIRVKGIVVALGNLGHQRHIDIIVAVLLRVRFGHE